MTAPVRDHRNRFARAIHASAAVERRLLSDRAAAHRRPGETLQDALARLERLA